MSRGSRDSKVPLDRARLQLQRVLDSATFATHDKHKGLLRFLGEQTLAGRDDLKELVIAVEHFELPNYDPKEDGFIRTDISRLRGSLKAYYIEEGKDDPVSVDVPVGSSRRNGYTVTFEWRSRSAGGLSKLPAAAISPLLNPEVLKALAEVAGPTDDQLVMLRQVEHLVGAPLSCEVCRELLKLSKNRVFSDTRTLQ